MDKLIIKGKPVFSLKACLNKLKKTNLQEVAEGIYGIENSSKLAEALTHYYGVCPVSHFRKVWNLHENTPNYTVDEFDDLLRRSAEFNFEYWYSDKKRICAQ